MTISLTFLTQTEHKHMLRKEYFCPEVNLELWAENTRQLMLTHLFLSGQTSLRGGGVAGQPQDPPPPTLPQTPQGLLVGVSTPSLPLYPLPQGVHALSCKSNHSHPPTYPCFVLQMASPTSFYIHTPTAELWGPSRK